MTKIRDILPPSDGWVGAIIPLTMKDSTRHFSVEDFCATMETVEFTLSGFYDDAGAGEPPVERN